MDENIIESSNDNLEVAPIFSNDITPDTINNILTLISYILLIEKQFNRIAAKISNKSQQKEITIAGVDPKFDLKLFNTPDVSKLLVSLIPFYVVRLDPSNYTLTIRSKYDLPLILYVNNQAVINPALISQLDTNSVAFKNLILILSIFNRFIYADRVGRETQNKKKINYVNSAIAQIVELANAKVREYNILINNTNNSIKSASSDNDLQKIITMILEDEITEDIYTNFLNAYEESSFNAILSNLEDEQRYVIWAFILTHTAVESQEINRLLNRIENSLQNNIIIRNERDNFELRRIDENDLLTRNNRVELIEDDQLLGLRPLVDTGFVQEVLRNYQRLILQANTNLEATKKEVKMEEEEIRVEEEEIRVEEVEVEVEIDVELEDVLLEDVLLENVSADRLAIFAAILNTVKGSFPDFSNVSQQIYNGVQNNINNIIENVPQYANNVSIDQVSVAFGAFSAENHVIALGILGLVFSVVFSYYYGEYVKVSEVIPDNGISEIISEVNVNPVVDNYYKGRDEDFVSRQVAQAKISYMMNWSTERFKQLWDEVPSILLYLPEGTGSWTKWFTITCITALTTYGLSVNPYFQIDPSLTSVALTTIGTTLVVEKGIDIIFDEKGNLLKIAKGTGDALTVIGSGAATVITTGVAGIGALGAITGVLLLGAAAYIIYRGVYKGEARTSVTVKQKQIFN